MASDASTTAEPQSLTEAILGKDFIASPQLAIVRAWPAEFRTTVGAALLGAMILIPFLGSVGLWDPWETHYGEVAREMIQRDDYVHPYWENAWFFSKPAFTMWMQALGMQAAEGGAMFAIILGALFLGGAYVLFERSKKLKEQVYELWAALAALPGAVFALMGLFGLTQSVQWKLSTSVSDGDGALPLFLEWGFRMPFAMSSIVAVTLMTWAVSRLVSPRAGIASALVLLTMPLYFLESRQAVTDIPIISATISGLSCAMVGLLDKRTARRTEWWYAAYIFFGVATLAKGLLGFGVPMVVFTLYVLINVLPYSSAALQAHVKWAQKYAMNAVAVGVVSGAIAGGIAFTLGSQWRTMFMELPPLENGRSLISAPGWLGIMWGSLAFWAGITVTLWRERAKIVEEPPALFRLMYEMKLGTGILLFLAVCLPWYYEMFTFWRVDDESKLFWYRFIIHDHFARLGAGVHTTTPGGNFTYFIEQGGYAMYPWVALVPAALATAARLKVRGPTTTDSLALMAVLWFVVTWALIGSSATKFHHYVFPMLPPLAILMGIFIDKLWVEGIESHGMVLLLGVPLFLLVGKDLAANPKDFTDLFVYNYDRPYPAMLVEKPEHGFGGNSIKALMGMGFALLGVLCGLFALLRAKVSLYATALTGVMVWALWFNWSHWVNLTHHWTQRDQFWRYFSQRRPDEPIAAFLMNWRGETFYSRNTVKQIKDNANVGMLNYAQQPGRKWSLVEHNRLGILKSAVGPDKQVTLIDKDLNNKFVLVTIE